MKIDEVKKTEQRLMPRSLTVFVWPWYRGDSLRLKVFAPNKPAWAWTWI